MGLSIRLGEAAKSRPLDIAKSRRELNATSPLLPLQRGMLLEEGRGYLRKSLWNRDCLMNSHRQSRFLKPSAFVL
jgi:hypothetical protein